MGCFWEKCGAVPGENVLPFKQVHQIVLHTPHVQSAIVEKLPYTWWGAQDESDLAPDPKGLMSPIAL